MRRKTNLLKIAILPVIFLMVSCVKDVDIDQYEEVVFTPEAAIDLVYFTLTAEDFSAAGNGTIQAADATRLDFLDDDYIQTGLLRAEFNYRFNNSFQKDVTAHIRFLSGSNRVQHSVVINIPAGNETSPAIIDYTEIINEDQIQKIKRSIKMSVEITMQDVPVMEGELQMKSKAFYYFEF